MLHVTIMTYLWSKQKGRHLADNILKHIFLEGIFISIKISLKFVSKGLLDNGATLVQEMAW